MDSSEREEIPMLSSGTFHSDDSRRVFSSRTRSASMSISSNSVEFSENDHHLVGFTGPLRNERRTSFVQMSGPLYANPNNEFVFQPPRAALRQRNSEPKIERYPSIDRNENNDRRADDYVGKNEYLLRSGQLGKCNDPYCTTCPLYYKDERPQKQSRTSEIFDARFHSMLYGDARGWAKRMCSFLTGWIPGVMSPHAKFVQQWNKFFVISCMFAAFLDPFFLFLLYVHKDNKCIVLDWPMTKRLVILRSISDCIYFIHILIQFRVAYVAPESTVTGAGDLVDDPEKIAGNYFRGYFIIDLIVVLPLPQIIVFSALNDSIGSPGANYGKILLQLAIFVQYVPRLFRFLPFVDGPSPTGSTFESAWAPFVTNLIILILTSHFFGSCWYLLGVERVNNCFENACPADNSIPCKKFIDCGYGHNYKAFEDDPLWKLWKNDNKTAACLQKDGYNFGIFETAVNLTIRKTVGTKYVYSFFWGFQQISTLAGNQVPSYSALEVVFTMGIIGSGLLLFALLIGNMQNFLQALERRRLEMSLRRRDVEQWMSHRRLPLELKRQVRESERFNWAATRGVNEDMLMENLPEDLQRNIRRHLFRFVEKVRIFQMLDEPIIDAICERLRTKTYIEGSKILSRGCVVDKMVFIIRGKMESIGEDLIPVRLSEGNVCGEELLTWCLEHSSVNKDGKRIRIPGHRLLGNRLVRCLTNVEAFVLRSADLEEVAGLFARFLKSPRVEGAIRYESPYWRALAARRIQVAWRYRKKRIGRAVSSSPPRN